MSKSTAITNTLIDGREWKLSMKCNRMCQLERYICIWYNTELTRITAKVKNVISLKRGKKEGMGLIEKRLMNGKD